MRNNRWKRCRDLSTHIQYIACMQLQVPSLSPHVPRSLEERHLRLETIKLRCCISREEDATRGDFKVSLGLALAIGDPDA